MLRGISEWREQTGVEEKIGKHCQYYANKRAATPDNTNKNWQIYCCLPVLSIRPFRPLRLPNDIKQLLLPPIRP